MAHALRNATYIAAAVSFVSIIACIISSISLTEYHPDPVATVIRAISLASAVLSTMIASSLHIAQYRGERPDAVELLGRADELE